MDNVDQSATSLATPIDHTPGVSGQELLSTTTRDGNMQEDYTIMEWWRKRKTKDYPTSALY